MDTCTLLLACVLQPPGIAPACMRVFILEFGGNEATVPPFHLVAS